MRTVYKFQPKTTSNLRIKTKIGPVQHKSVFKPQVSRPVFKPQTSLPVSTAAVTTAAVTPTSSPAATSSPQQTSSPQPEPQQEQAEEQTEEETEEQSEEEQVDDASVNGLGAQFGLTSYSEDIEAINRYFKSVKPINNEASGVVADWAIWYASWKSKGWYDQTFNADLWNQARSLRDKFNKANGTPAPAGALRAEDLGQSQPLGGLLGNVPSDIATKGVLPGLWRNIPTPAKVGGGVILGLLVLKAFK